MYAIYIYILYAWPINADIYIYIYIYMNMWKDIGNLFLLIENVKKKFK